MDAGPVPGHKGKLVYPDTQQEADRPASFRVLDGL